MISGIQAFQQQNIKIRQAPQSPQPQKMAFETPKTVVSFSGQTEEPKQPTETAPKEDFFVVKNLKKLYNADPRAAIALATLALTTAIATTAAIVTNSPKDAIPSKLDGETVELLQKGLEPKTLPDLIEGLEKNQPNKDVPSESNAMDLLQKSLKYQPLPELLEGLIKGQKSIDPGIYMDGPDGRDIDPGIYMDGPDGRDIDPGIYMQGKELPDKL